MVRGGCIAGPFGCPFSVTLERTADAALRYVKFRDVVSRGVANKISRPERGLGLIQRRRVRRRVAQDALVELMEAPMSLFSRNLGAIDRSLRVLGGVVLLALVGMDAIGPWGYVGLVPLLTGIIGTCPLYAVLGLRSCARR
jgi:hypothetical protein